MSEVVKTEKAPKKSLLKKLKSWFKGLKSELKKIVWPDKKTLGKQTIAVLTVSAALCVLISVIDAVITFGVGFLAK
jgi:preprotein translocase, SecE subunit, bacterial